MPLRRKTPADSPAAVADNLEGVRVSRRELMGLRLEAARLTAAATDGVPGLFAGGYRSLFRGRGLEFDEVRLYQPGDDYRTLDWRVTARTGQFHTKLFQEEREHSLNILIDAGPGMQFGSRNAFKWVVAARVAALFAWLAVGSGDRVGGIVFGDGRYCHRCPPAGGQSAAARLFSLLAALPAAQPTIAGSRSTLADALILLRRTARPGSPVLILGDYTDLPQGAEPQLTKVARHHGLLGVMLYDPLEADLPPPGAYAFSDGEGRLGLSTRDRALRKAFRQRFQARRERAAGLLQRNGGRFFVLGTQDPWIHRLREGLLIQRRQRSVADSPTMP